jgi:multiple sugar transport system ATP-binding protein
MTMGQRICVLYAGKIQQVGTPLDLYDHPTNVFVAQFIGTPPMNLVKGTIADNGLNIVAPKIKIPVPKGFRNAGFSDGKKVIFGVRPENILYADEKGRGETAGISADVEIVEPLGHEVVVYARAGDDLLCATLDPHRAPKMGDKLDLLVELDALHLFDAETEKRIIKQEG